ncbi:MAG TPA: inositol 2-dehydrogenase [Kiloniellales bacterium]|nr:inositol 2-dehydrogenase [Kiloniellales bacterium]
MIRFALFGAGRIGALHADNIAAHSDAALACVYDVHAPAARKVARRHGAEVAPDVQSIMGDSEIEAVLIASSTDTHVELITRAAKAGKAIFCEKPIDLDIKRVERCRKAIAGRDVPIQLGFNRRYDPSHRALREAVRRDEIGPVELLVISSRDPAPPSLDYLRGSGGLFRDMTIHDFDLARFILGEEPIEVSAMGAVRVDPEIGGIGDIDSAMVTMKSASGTLVHINNSRRAVYGYDQRVEAFGAKGMLISDNRRATSLTRHNRKTTEARDPLLEFFVERYAEAYRLELDDFISAVAKGKAPAVGFEDGRRALILANCAERASRSGKSVVVDYG